MFVASMSTSLSAPGCHSNIAAARRFVRSLISVACSNAAEISYAASGAAKHRTFRITSVRASTSRPPSGANVDDRAPAAIAAR